MRRFLKRTYSLERLNALSDGVYAFSLTLLVLDLKAPEIPGVTNPELIADLLEQVPNFIAYIISFLIVAFFWIIHHRILHSVTKCDEQVLKLNLLHLLFVTLTPYVASLIGHYEGDRIAMLVFSADLGLASLSLDLLGIYTLGKQEWRTDETNGTWRAMPWWADKTKATSTAVACIVSGIEPIFRSMTKELIKGGIVVADSVSELASETGEKFKDLLADAKSEMQTSKVRATNKTASGNATKG